MTVGIDAADLASRAESTFGWFQAGAESEAALDAICAAALTEVVSAPAAVRVLAVAIKPTEISVVLDAKVVLGGSWREMGEGVWSIHPGKVDFTAPAVGGPTLFVAVAVRADESVIAVNVAGHRVRIAGEAAEVARAWLLQVLSLQTHDWTVAVNGIGEELLGSSERVLAADTDSADVVFVDLAASDGAVELDGRSVVELTPLRKAFSGDPDVLLVPRRESVEPSSLIFPAAGTFSVWAVRSISDRRWNDIVARVNPHPTPTAGRGSAVGRRHAASPAPVRRGKSAREGLPLRPPLAPSAPPGLADPAAQPAAAATEIAPVQPQVNTPAPTPGQRPLVRPARRRVTRAAGSADSIEPDLPQPPGASSEPEQAAEPPEVGSASPAEGEVAEPTQPVAHVKDDDAEPAIELDEDVPEDALTNNGPSTPAVPDSHDGLDADEEPSSPEPLPTAASDDGGEDWIWVRILGPIEVSPRKPGKAPDATPSVLAFAAYIATRTRQVNVTDIDEAMWSGQGDVRRHRSNLFTKLRSWFGEVSPGVKAIGVAGNKGIFTPNPDVLTDWDVWQRLVDGEPVHASTEDLEAACELVRGAPFDGARQNDYHWMRVLTDAIRPRVCDGCLELAERYHRDGRYSDAAEIALRGVEVDYLRQDLWRLALTACSVGGLTRRAHDIRLEIAEKLPTAELDHETLTLIRG